MCGLPAARHKHMQHTCTTNAPHHRHQLIYAVGSPVPLPERDERVAVMHALLRVTARVLVGTHTRTKAGTTPGICLTDRAAVLEPPCKPLHTIGGAAGAAAGKQVEVEAKYPGAWSGLRLLAGEALEAEAGTLRVQLAEELLRDPPYALMWLKDKSPTLKVLMLSALSCLSTELTKEGREGRQLQFRTASMVHSWLSWRPRLVS